MGKEYLELLVAVYKTRAIGTGVITRISEEMGISAHEVEKLFENAEELLELCNEI